jgi:hypothetical protein
MWVACRVLSVGLLATLIVCGALDVTASEFADGVVFVLTAAFITVSVVICVVVAWVLWDLWREES